MYIARAYNMHSRIIYWFYLQSNTPPHRAVFASLEVPYLGEAHVVASVSPDRWTTNLAAPLSSIKLCWQFSDCTCYHSYPSAHPQANVCGMTTTTTNIQNRSGHHKVWGLLRLAPIIGRQTAMTIYNHTGPWKSHHICRWVGRKDF